MPAVATEISFNAPPKKDCVARAILPSFYAFLYGIDLNLL
jgi:hypothetical protein